MTTSTAPEIDAKRASELLSSDGATFVDVRDPQSHVDRRIPGSSWLHNDNLNDFVSSADKARPVVVYCFKGNMSRGAALMLLEKGFKEVYSLTGGMAEWSGETTSGVPSADAPQGLSVTDLAKSKLEGYLSGEKEGTRVRVTVDGERWGLSLDDANAGDVTFEASGLPFVLDGSLLGPVAGLTIDFLEEGPTVGFSLEGGTPPKPPGEEEMLADITQRIADNKLMVFLKGTAAAPMCGFSARTVATLKELGVPFGDKNVLEDPRYRYVLSGHSNWPTIPQVFLDGEFIGGCDIVTEMHQKGELKTMVDAAFGK